MKQNVYPLHTGVPDLVEPFRGWQLVCAWIVAALVIVFILVGAWTVGNKAVGAFATLVAPTVTPSATRCER